MPMNIAEFAFIIYLSTDQVQSPAFYEGILGFTPAISLPIPDGLRIEYEIGQHTLAVGKEPF